MRFLCLHGSGTNSNIFEIQTATIRYEIGANHEFEFAEGSEVCPTEYIPVGIKSHFPNEEGYYVYFDPSSAASILTAVDDLAAYLDTEGPFDALMAFSQGASLAGTLMHKLLVQQRQRHEGAENTELYSSTISNQSAQEPLQVCPFKCAVLLSAATPFSYPHLVQGVVRELTPETDGVLFTLPTLHVLGRNDLDFPGMSEAVVGLAFASTRLEVVHDGGHEIPRAPKELVKNIVEGIDECVQRANLVQ